MNQDTSASEQWAKWANIANGALKSLGRHPDVAPYTSPRLLQKLLDGCHARDGRLFDAQPACSHDLLLLPHQSRRPISSVQDLSCVCRICRHHFHVSMRSEWSAAHETNHDMSMHMFVLWMREKRPDNTAPIAVAEKLHFVCAVTDCYCSVEISLLEPIFSLPILLNLRNVARMERNLAQASEDADDGDRFSDFDKRHLNRDKALATLRTYLRDGLSPTIPNQVGPRRIKRRNKSFRIFFGNDFDNLFRALGFEEKMVEDEQAKPDDTCWVFPSLPTGPNGGTQLATLRAKWEDALVELDVLVSDAPANPPAWPSLQTTLYSFYERVTLFDAQGTTPDVSSAALLGCSVDYLPAVYVWAAKLLAGKCPSLRGRFVEAAANCGLQRDPESELELVMFDSVATDTAKQPSDPRSEAYKFFSAMPKDGKDANYFVSKYMSIIDSTLPDDSRKRALEYLRIIGKDLGQDLVGIVCPEETGQAPDMAAPGEPMTKTKAEEILGIQPNYTMELITDTVNVLAQSHNVNRVQAAEALKYMAGDRSSEGKLDEATQFMTMANVFEDSLPPLGTLPLEGSINGDATLAPMRNAPPGLHNIGNTCYLNSLLQYFYNVKVIRDLIINYDEYKLPLDPESIAGRRTGGSAEPLNLDEAIVARQFAESLQALFADLMTITGACSRPSQKLANTALYSARTLLAQSKPPPLPARPSPAPPTLNEGPNNNDKDKDTVNVTVEPVSDKLETGSNASAETLVNDSETKPGESYVEVNVAGGKGDSIMTEGTQADPICIPVEDSKMDVEMTGAEPEPMTLDERIRRISERLEQSDSQRTSGTDQEDLEEIMGNIVEHLMRAIKPNGPMSVEELNPLCQSDVITETFWPVVVNQTWNTDEGEKLSHMVQAERWIQAYPDPLERETKTIYQALDQGYDLEAADGGGPPRIALIRRLPPILHVVIQRAVNPRKKNRTPIAMYEHLYMDRYMETASNSTLGRRRREVWALQEVIKDMKEAKERQSQFAVGEASGGGGGDKSDLDGMSWGNGTAGDLMDWSSGNGTAGDQGDWGGRVDGSGLDPESSEWDMLEKIVPRDAVKMTGEDGSSTAATATLAPSPATATVASPATAPGGAAAAATASSAGFVPLLQSHLPSMTSVDEAQLAAYQHTVDTAFDDLRQHKYALHAVICHGGGMQAGHYWVWIRDFEARVWRKYNDSRVTEDARPDGQALLDELSLTGDPYFLAYVRDECKGEMVEVPPRAEPSGGNGNGHGGEFLQQQGQGHQSQGGQGGGQSEDVEMETIEGVRPGPRKGGFFGDEDDDVPDLVYGGSSSGNNNGGNGGKRPDAKMVDDSNAG